MVKSCCVDGCEARLIQSVQECGLSFHFFPKKDKRRRKWTKALKQTNFKPTNTTVLCSAHFTEDDFSLRPGSCRRRLKGTAVPSIFPNFVKFKSRQELSSSDGYQKHSDSHQEIEVLPLCNTEESEPYIQELCIVEMKDVGLDFREDSQVISNFRDCENTFNHDLLQYPFYHMLEQSIGISDSQYPSNIKDPHQNELSNTEPRTRDQAVQTIDSALPTTVAALQKQIKLLKEMLTANYMLYRKDIY